MDSPPTPTESSSSATTARSSVDPRQMPVWAHTGICLGSTEDLAVVAEDDDSVGVGGLSIDDLDASGSAVGAGIPVPAPSDEVVESVPVQVEAST